MSTHHLPSLAAWLLVPCTLVLAAGCGGGGFLDVFYDPVGDVEVDNQTDLTGEWLDVVYFEMSPSGTLLGTGNLVPGGVFPGEIVYAGSFTEDWYDAEAILDDFPFPSSVFFPDVFVEGGFTTTFEVF